MDIREFVGSTILQIMEGVADTQERARELGGYVNPAANSFAGSATHVGKTATDQAIYTIDFDIAVSVAGEANLEAGAKLQVASIISIGGKGKSTDKHESISRVKFAVPLTLPIDKASTQERHERDAVASAKLRGASRGSNF